MSFHVEPALETDVEAIARVHVQGWRESYKDFLNPASLAGLSVEERARMWRSTFTAPDPRALLLVGRASDGEIVGFVCGGPVRLEDAVSLDTAAEVYAIYLLDKVKGQGLGRRLMAGLFDHLTGQGFSSAGLWVLRDNLSARRFYERLGGKPGPGQELELRGQTVTEIAYRFDPIPTIR
ncbi:GNAT family N-acetyltransferase [Microvirga puerhi]|uniref:GNAT family N-acetyltransferase n=1 Tax=Microvirga puerhi TaxID=2876078 RepID=A0ABS7VNF7_9HYPH|nr:GNAT family N-acetyltransferase [Microvirga puerhi]MBZ6076567.1 GNAT family N-acetyltransferase [Microvirga puerhi]